MVGTVCSPSGGSGGGSGSGGVDELEAATVIIGVFCIGIPGCLWSGLGLEGQRLC